MNETPERVTGAYPATPGTNVRGRAPPTPDGTPERALPNRGPAANPLPLAPENQSRQQPGSNPVIPLTILDAPTQRFYAFGFYIALVAWKLYEWVGLMEDESNSVWLFLKWNVIDLIFIMGLPELRIPWLELTQPACLVLFFGHAIFNFVLMFNITAGFTAALLAFLKVFYDRELAISEHYVQPAHVLHNASVILGKQIINILPEGSAVLNPDGQAFCLGDSQPTITLPLLFNETVPIEVEIIRVDLETNVQETLKLGKDQIRTITKMAKRLADSPEESEVKFDYPVKKPGVYRLGRVLDEYKLEVQRLTGNTFVVPCPKARVLPSVSSDRCLGDLSDLSLQVEGTPPLKIVYSQMINGKDHSFHFQSLQPEGFSSPLMGSSRSSALVLPDDESYVTWARAQVVTVGLNESMNSGGEWQYSVDEVQDAFGNVVKYASPADDPEMRPKPKHLVQQFSVKDRPTVSLFDCNMRHPLKVAKGKSTSLPVKYEIAEQKSTKHTITWLYSPIDTLTKNGDHGEAVTTGTYHAKKADDVPSVSAPGLYTLKSVSAGVCEGEVQEPSSCLLLNPLEPSLVLRSSDIPDKCAGNSIGISVDFDFVGTPPFVVNYKAIHNGSPERRSFKATSMRHQEEFIPTVAGTHKYIFESISDRVYPSQQLSGPGMTLETTVKPVASASIRKPSQVINACLEEEVQVDVVLQGEAPFTLEWELVHDGRRRQHKISDIQDKNLKIQTPPLTQGGEYSVALIAITDTSGCRSFLQDEMKISVRRQRPRGAFGQLDGKFRTRTLEEAKVRLPVRLSGEGPWDVSFKNLDDGDTAQVNKRKLKSGNDFLTVDRRGVYEIVDVSDNKCPGVVDPRAAQFEVDWLPRPELGLVQTPSISLDREYVYSKNEVCEGDIDGFEIALKGSPPFHVEYQVKHKDDNGGMSSPHKKTVDAALGKASIQMDTSTPGLYAYQFTGVQDSVYVDNKKLNSVTLHQTVNPRPDASFIKPGQTYKSCMADQDIEETIPIELKGTAPFSLEIEIKHQSGAGLETYRIPSIPTNKFDIQIPRQYLKLGGQSVRIRQVGDAHGCRRTYDTGGPSVQVQLFDAPTIYELEGRQDYCVGERIGYTLSGTPPFEVWYTFDGQQRKAKSPTTSFRRLAEYAGTFAITSISDRASECNSNVNITKIIHPMPSVKISKGKTSRASIHEGGEVNILFEFTGTPPFEFVYTRSTNAKKGQRSQVLETRADMSYEFSKVVKASQEGTYEVISIRDQHCSFQTAQVHGETSDKLLQY
ncbi:hypothetical protein N8I77_003751 [Diaporthe amygdali]|uniref:Nucleoporin Pom152 n=1 Tax=Phomopsis amygdali TaxID=1214568 RepID=A0AAD9SIL9_PHOAM|nr:hypothetical protein N8I77_003751 [Diaporthe amygdali]KAK2610306.1 hypothetical protein N8I77_003751 [Diaporthe amygdali]